MVFRLIPFVFLLTLGACAPVDPVGGGQIRWRCDPNADSGNSTICAPGQYPLCVIGADAGNGRSPGLCCDSTETESSCLQRSGLVPADAGRAPANDR